MSYLFYYVKTFKMIGDFLKEKTSEFKVKKIDHFMIDFFLDISCRCLADKCLFQLFSCSIQTGFNSRWF